MCLFYLGIHEPAWMRSVAVPLFVSARRLRRRQRPPNALGVWALDSGAFTEIDTHGEWTIPPLRYAREVERWQREIGNLRWAAIQDWMCEPFMIQKTGLSVEQHQLRTCASYRDLVSLAPGVPWVPVLQGYRPEEYLRHYEMYLAGGVRLGELPLVGVGSVCRRQHTEEAEVILALLARLGLRLHAFGFKIEGLRRCHHYLASADSMAWSKGLRRRKWPGCRSSHRACANCRYAAVQWRNRVCSIPGVE